MNKDEETFGSELVEGSRYLVRSLDTRDKTLETRGEFKGYLFIGRDQGLRMILDDSHDVPGTIRIIPCHMIINIDVINQVHKIEEKSKKGDSYIG